MSIEQKVNAIMRYIVAENEEERGKAIERIKAIVASVGDEKRGRNIEDVISEIFVELGMPEHIIGYRYSTYATKLVAENPELINSVVRELYPTVAKEFGTTASKVERGIRHGIERTWDNCDIETTERYFGNTVSASKGKPTNSEFIARIANIVRRRIQNG